MMMQEIMTRIAGIMALSKSSMRNLAMGVQVVPCWEHGNAIQNNRKED